MLDVNQQLESWLEMVEIHVATNPAIHYNNRDLEDILGLTSNKMFIAGGAARLWYEGREVGQHDIDVYFANQEDWLNCFDKMDKKHTRTFTSANAVTFDVQKKYKIQLIRTQYNSDPHKIIENFDISVCQIATDGERWYMGKNFTYDLKNHILRFESVTPKFLKRYIKYQAYGFEPIQSLAELEAMCLDNVIWDYSTVDDHGDYDAN